MVCDSIQNAGLYQGLHGRFDKAFSFLRKAYGGPLPAPGKCEIQGEEVYALVQEYETRPAEELLWEAHRAYIDIQFVYSGSEGIGWADAGTLSPQGPYDAQGDCILGQAKDGTLLAMQGGQFAIFFPQDAHKPKCALAGAEKITKIIIKVKI